MNTPKTRMSARSPDGKAIGAIELKLNGHTDLTERDDECELGYWLGKPFWGQGIMTGADGRRRQGPQLYVDLAGRSKAG